MLVIFPAKQRLETTAQGTFPTRQAVSSGHKGGPCWKKTTRDQILIGQLLLPHGCQKDFFQGKAVVDFSKKLLEWAKRGYICFLSSKLRKQTIFAEIVKIDGAVGRFCFSSYADGNQLKKRKRKSIF